jgi:hypothetical protein
MAQQGIDPCNVLRPKLTPVAELDEWTRDVPSQYASPECWNKITSAFEQEYNVSAGSVSARPQTSDNALCLIEHLRVTQECGLTIALCARQIQAVGWMLMRSPQQQIGDTSRRRDMPLRLRHKHGDGSA